MDYNTGRIPDESITTWELNPDWDWADSEKANAILRNMWDEMGYPAYHIVLINLPDDGVTLEDLQAGFNIAAYGPDALYAHPNLKLTVLVSENAMVKLAVKNIQEIEHEGVYKKVAMTTASTQDEALNLIHEDRAS